VSDLAIIAYILSLAVAMFFFQQFSIFSTIFIVGGVAQW